MQGNLVELKIKEGKSPDAVVRELLARLSRDRPDLVARVQRRAAGGRVSKRELLLTALSELFGGATVQLNFPDLGGLSDAK